MWGVRDFERGEVFRPRGDRSRQEKKREERFSLHSGNEQFGRPAKVSRAWRRWKDDLLLPWSKHRSAVGVADKKKAAGICSRKTRQGPSCREKGARPVRVEEALKSRTTNPDWAK